MLQEFYGEIAGRETFADVAIALQVFLHVANAVLYLVSVVYVDMSQRVLLVCPLVNLNNSGEEVVHSASVPEDGRHEREAQQFAKVTDVQFVASSLKFVVHV